MRTRKNGALAVAVSFLLVTTGYAGCAPKRQTLRGEGSGVAVRLPPVEAMDVHLRSERLETPPKLPLSLADETRDRWLTLFEVTFSPVSTGSLPEEGPSKK